MDRGGFIDYYEFMQISPNAEPETVQRVYRMLASRYHPDNPETGDMELFLLLNQAHEVLSDTAQRSAYDAVHQSQAAEPITVFSMKEFARGIDGEDNRRMGILCLLYRQRRTNPDHPGLTILDLENMMAFPREHLLFTLWYLREKDFLRLDAGSMYVVTSSGVDYVEEHLPKNRVLYKLLNAAEAGASYRPSTSPEHRRDTMQ